MTTETFVKDIKPGLKNLNLIFIVLETGGMGTAGSMEDVGEGASCGLCAELARVWRGSAMVSCALHHAANACCWIHSGLFSTQSPLHGAGPFVPCPLLILVNHTTPIQMTTCNAVLLQAE